MTTDAHRPADVLRAAAVSIAFSVAASSVRALEARVAHAAARALAPVMPDDDSRREAWGHGIVLAALVTTGLTVRVARAARTRHSRPATPDA